MNSNRTGFLERKIVSAGSIRILSFGVGLLLSAWIDIMAEAQSRYPLMRFTPEQIREAEAQHFSKPFTGTAKPTQTFPPALSLLSWLPYVPEERNQGACGNCWAWAGTGIMEIAHHVQNGVKERLSVQFMTSCNGTVACCEGGGIPNIVEFYSARQAAVPWSNSGARWLSGSGSCESSSCGTISTSPAYPVTHVAMEPILTHSVGRAQATANIKAVLNQNRAIYFSFYMPLQADWDGFFDFWDYEPRTAIWSNFSCGKSVGTGDGAHAVLCVGYNEEDAANPYWIMVNSWGTAAGRRPDGVFHVSMNLNYDCASGRGEHSLHWQTLDLKFGGGSVVHVDGRYSGAGADGTFVRPYSTLRQGLTAVPECGILRIRSGSYDERVTLNRCMRLESYDGLAHVGGSISPPATAPVISTPGLQHGGIMFMSIASLNGQRYQALVSTNLLTWSLWRDFSASGSQTTLIDAEVANHPMRFFRLVVP